MLGVGYGSEVPTGWANGLDLSPEGLGWADNLVGFWATGSLNGLGWADALWARAQLISHFLFSL